MTKLKEREMKAHQTHCGTEVFSYRLTYKLHSCCFHAHKSPQAQQPAAQAWKLAASITSERRGAQEKALLTPHQNLTAPYRPACFESKEPMTTEGRMSKQLISAGTSVRCRQPSSASAQH